jgi:hypothetical protein
MLDVVRGLELGIRSFSFLLIVLFRQGGADRIVASDSAGRLGFGWGKIKIKRIENDSGG